MGQKVLKKKTLSCIENHLYYSINAILRDSKSCDLNCICDYSDKHFEVCNFLVHALKLVYEINEESRNLSDLA